MEDGNPILVPWTKARAASDRDLLITSSDVQTPASGLTYLSIEQPQEVEFLPLSSKKPR
jgi:hypothetical protein